MSTAEDHLRVFRKRVYAVSFLRESMILACQSPALIHMRGTSWQEQIGHIADVLEDLTDEELRDQRVARRRAIRRGNQLHDQIGFTAAFYDPCAQQVMWLGRFALKQAVGIGREFDRAWPRIRKTIEQLELPRAEFEDLYAKWRYRDLVPAKSRSLDGERAFRATARVSLEFAEGQLVLLET